jgi:hypothetical protein
VGKEDDEHLFVEVEQLRITFQIDKRTTTPLHGAQAQDRVTALRSVGAAVIVYGVQGDAVEAVWATQGRNNSNQLASEEMESCVPPAGGWCCQFLPWGQDESQPPEGRFDKEQYSAMWLEMQSASKSEVACAKVEKAVIKAEASNQKVLDAFPHAVEHTLEQGALVVLPASEFDMFPSHSGDVPQIFGDMMPSHAVTEAHLHRQLPDVVGNSPASNVVPPPLACLGRSHRLIRGRHWTRSLCSKQLARLLTLCRASRPQHAGALGASSALGRATLLPASFMQGSRWKELWFSFPRTSSFLSVPRGLFSRLAQEPRGNRSYRSMRQ